MARTGERRPRRLIVSVLAALVLGLLGIVGVLMFVFSSSDSDRGPDPAEMLRLTREWARLAPLPEPNTSFAIEETGNTFTRGFEAMFVAEKASIERWLNESPGTRSSRPAIDASGVRTFTIDPGGGAQFAKVMVNDATGMVRISVSWS